MTLPSETVTLAGSGLVFVNAYSAAVSAAYRGAIITAENTLQAQFTNAVTVNMDFDFAPLTSKFAAQSSFHEVTVSYAAFAAALLLHATTASDVLAVAGLPRLDPSGGIGFSIPMAEAVVLGLAPQSATLNETVTLNSNLPYSFGQDAVGALEHEITEGVFGRTSSLGVAETTWSPLDLFRFTASGARDVTGGRDGVAAFFGVDSAHVTALAYHNSINAAGLTDGLDLGDWSSAPGDAFGLVGPGAVGSLSATDLQVLDILGWTPSGSGAGVVLVGALGGDTILAPESNDTITGGAGGANYLRGNGGDDSIVGAAGFDDINGNKGNDTISGDQTAGGDWLVGGQGNDVVIAHLGHNLVYGNLGADTLTAGSGGDVVLGGQGDDSIVGGAGNDYISGDRGNDTETGGAGADTFHSFAGAGVDRVLDFHVSEGDQVRLDPGTLYLVSQVGADTVVNMGHGDAVVLAGVQLTTLTGAWVIVG